VTVELITAYIKMRFHPILSTCHLHIVLFMSKRLRLEVQRPFLNNWYIGNFPKIFSVGFSCELES